MAQTIRAEQIPEISQVARLDIVTGSQPKVLIHDPASGRMVELERRDDALDVPGAQSRSVATQTVGISTPEGIRQLDAATVERLAGDHDSSSAYLDGVAFAGNLTALHRATLGSQDVLLTAPQTGSGISVHRILPDGQLAIQNSVPDTNGRHLDHIVAIDSAELNGRHFVVAASATENGVSVLELASNGSLVHRSSFGSDDQLPVSDPSNLIVSKVGDQTFVFMTSYTSASVTAIELLPNGSLRFVDQVNDSQSTRFGGTTALDTIEINNQTWLAAAGNDGGISLFQVLDSGRLVLKDTLIDTVHSSLNGVSHLRFMQIGDQVELLALSTRDAGLTRLSLNLNDQGSTVTSTGDDILVDTAMADTLTGGAGADIFLFLPDGEPDTITDFNPDEDQIDLSAFQGVHSVDDFIVTDIAGGLRLRWQDEVLTIQTDNGAALPRFALSPELLSNADRVLIPDALPQTGSSGNDRFRWSDGPDTIDGGAGIDVMSYAMSRTPATVDLANSALNTRSAAGDVLLNIEALEGTGGNDVFYGDGTGNTLTGFGGNDRLVGRGGTDWFNPGKGNDTVDGGAGSDMVSFSDLQWSVRVDLTTGLAVGNGQTDTLLDVENVTGTVHGDYIVGDAGDNRIRGLGDYDWMVGSEGRDQYDGGNGRDMVSYVNATSRVVVDLGAGRGTEGQAAGDTYVSIERVTGSVHSDQLYGSSGEDDFRGLGGYDWFIGSGGGKDRYDGGNGLDTVAYWNAPTGVIASLRLGRGSAGDAARDLYTSIENLAGSSHADVLTGDDGRNTLRGYWGEDELIGGGGVDRLIGGPSDDWLDGGSGWDYAIFSGNRRDYGIEKRGEETFVTHRAGNEGTDTLVNIEVLQFADDVFYV